MLSLYRPIALYLLLLMSIALFLLLAMSLFLFGCAPGDIGSSSVASPTVSPTYWMTGHEHEDDAAKFAAMYPVSEDNPFLIASFDEAVRHFEIGTGILVFGFPECPRCHNAFPVLEKAFREMGMDQHEGYNGKILYYDIFDDREADSERYRALVKYTESFLRLDDNGNPRIYSPDVFFVSSGVIVGNHLDTVPSLTNPRDMLNDEQEAELMGIYMDLMAKMEDCGC